MRGKEWKIIVLFQVSKRKLSFFDCTIITSPALARSSSYIQIIFQFAIFYHSERFILKGNDIIKLKAKITL